MFSFHYLRWQQYFNFNLCFVGMLFAFTKVGCIQILINNLGKEHFGTPFVYWFKPLWLVYGIFKPIALIKSSITQAYSIILVCWKLGRIRDKLTFRLASATSILTGDPDTESIGICELSKDLCDLLLLPNVTKTPRF